MTAETGDTEAVWENPLIPNAKLKQIYRAMVRAREVARALPSSRREGLGMEACLVSTAVDLGPLDVVSDAISGGVVEFLRGATVGEALRPGKAKPGRGPVADCGSASRLPAGMDVAERMWAVMGAAATLKGQELPSQSNDVKKRPKDSPVIVAYVRASEVPTALWKKALTFAVEKELPVVFVVLPERGAKRGSGVRALAQRCHVPAIPVDADDAVAIYRVAQESIGRARIGVGPALMECVPFELHGSANRGSAKNDGIKGLESYLLQRKVVTPTWMKQEAKEFARRVVREKAASK